MFLKLQRPGLADYFAYEEAIMNDAMTKSDSLEMKSMWLELSTTMKNELNFNHEAAELVRAKKVYTRTTGRLHISVPRVWRSSGTWILMDLLPGSTLAVKTKVKARCHTCASV